jgi:heme-degrading monooxygenase HmoA
LVAEPVASERFTYIWQYTIEPERRSAFLAAYKPGGEWTELFARDPSYIETKLLQDLDDSDRYITVDIWKSKASRDAFRERYSSEFEALDRKCEAFTKQESFLGDCTEVEGASG